MLLLLLVFSAVLWSAGHHVSTGPAQGSALNGPPATAPVGRYLRLGTFNIDGGQGLDEKINLDRTASCLQKLDFIGLNEVHGFFSGNPINQAQAIAGKLHLPYLYVPAERQWWHDSFGNAIFTDLPVQHWQRFVLPNKPFAANRNYLLTDVTWGGTPLHFITTHTDWKEGGSEQFEIVTQAFLHLPAPAVLMGDLNTPNSDPKIQKLLATPGVEESINAIFGPQPGRVDWIFLRGLKTIDAGIVDIKASDHPAYWAQVALIGPPPRKVLSTQPKVR